VGEAIINGTLNIAALLLAPMIAWSLARNKDFDNPVSAVVIAVSSFIIMMPMHRNLPRSAARPRLTSRRC
jgi:PTS system cellobiose-specific IIC component